MHFGVKKWVRCAHTSTAADSECVETADTCATARTRQHYSNADGGCVSETPNCPSPQMLTLLKRGHPAARFLLARCAGPEGVPPCTPGGRGPGPAPTLGGAVRKRLSPSTYPGSGVDEGAVAQQASHHLHLACPGRHVQCCLPTLSRQDARVSEPTLRWQRIKQAFL